ncbi:MAG: tetratricopeptide repeat protein [Vicinamibacteria bacterium]|nr:tetratricopeptide repeat protein [Vicinamibacteria bacterium]
MASSDCRRPVMVVVAGAPGSGKSVLFPVHRTGFDHFNFHERCAELNDGSRVALPAEARTRARREHARFIAEHVRYRRSFAVESNLVEDATLRHARVASRNGFITRLIYLRAADVETLIERVHKRSLGGGAVLCPEQVAELYRGSIEKLDEASAVFDSVTIFDNSHRPTPTTSRPRGERAHAYLTAGLNAFESGRFDEAVDAFRQAIFLDRELADAYQHLGLAYERLGNWHLARHVFFELARLRPDDPATYFQLGMACFEIHSWKEAAEAFRDVLALRPTDAEALQRLGVCYNATGEPEKAVPFLLRAMSAKLSELRPGDASSQLHLALACCDLSAWPEARSVFEEIRRIRNSEANGEVKGVV